MAYVQIEDFKTGLDRRRSAAAGIAGSLWVGSNGHITRGGDFEAAKKFVLDKSLPAGTFGCHAAKGILYVFGSIATPAGVPAGVQYQRLQHSDSATAMSRLLWAENFNGKVYAIAEFADGSVFHYYDGARVTSWDTHAATSSLALVGDALAALVDDEAAYVATSLAGVVTITAAAPGTAFTISASATNNGGTNDQTATVATPTANVVGVAEVRATGQIEVTGGAGGTIDSITVDGVDVLGAAVAWTSSHAATAALVATQINAHTSVPNYTATVSNAVVTIRAAAGTGAGPNGYAVVPATTGLVAVGGVVNMTGGVTAVAAVAQVSTVTLAGTFDVLDSFRITLDGANFTVAGGAPGTGKAAVTYGSKVYSVAGSFLRFSSVDSPTAWTSGTGFGNVNMANQDGGSEELTGLGVYQGNLAVPSRSTIQIEFVDPDPALNTLLQPLKNTGTRAARSMVSYGNNDLFYLAETGVRSVRARDSSNSASVSDVGTAIDPLIREFSLTLTGAQIARAAGVIEPVDSRYMLALGSKIFVFSFFPGSKISAWTTYEPGFSVSDWAVIRDRLYARSGDSIYLYGGSNGDTYPGDGEVTITMQLPYMDGGKPGHMKTIEGFDAILEGEWSVHLLTDPDDETKKTATVVLTDCTYPDGRVPFRARTSHFAPVLVNTKGGRAKVSNLAVHYSLDEAT